jgi:hypothetical protein
MVVAQDEKTGEEYAAPVKQDLNGRHYLAGVPKKIK